MLNSGGKKLYVKVSFCVNICIVIKWSLFNMYSVLPMQEFMLYLFFFKLGNTVIQSGQHSGVQPSPAESISDKFHTSGYASLQRYI